MASGSRLTWPLRRILDPRFADVNRRIAKVTEDVEALRAQIEGLQAQVGALHAHNDSHAESLVEISVHVGERLDVAQAALGRIEQRLK